MLCAEGTPPHPQGTQTLARQRPGAHEEVCLHHSAIATVPSGLWAPFTQWASRTPPSTAKYLKAGRHTRALFRGALPTTSIWRPRPPHITTLPRRSPVPEHFSLTPPQPPVSHTSYPPLSSHKRPDQNRHIRPHSSVSGSALSTPLLYPTMAAPQHSAWAPGATRV